MIKTCAKGGDQAAWREFIARLQPVVAATVIKTLRGFHRLSPELVDDLVQDSYVRLFQTKALQSFRSDEANSIFGLMQTIAYSTVQDYFRSQSTQKRGGEMRQVPLEVAGAGAAKDRGDIERQTLLGQIEAVLKQVTGVERDRAIFWFHYKQGMTAKEISQLRHLGLSEKGIESVLHRLLPEIRKRVKGFEC